MEIYDKLGVKKLINAAGTLTNIGSSLMRPEVLEAMTEASEHYVDMHELHEKVGRRIAELVGVEAAFVTSGASGGLLLATAACMTGTDPAKIRRLPDTTGMKNEVIVFKSHRHVFDGAIVTAGARLVEIGLVYTDRIHPWELEAAINGNTAAVSYCAACEDVPGSLPLREVVEVAKKAGIPVIVDAAAELPPVSNLHNYTDTGADLAIFSGGKDIGGPQSAGLILGQKDLVEACVLNSCPYHTTIGRPLKVDKETLIGMLVALELYLKQDFDASMRTWDKQVDYLVERLSSLPHVEVTKGYPTQPGIQPYCIPRAYVALDEKQLGTTKEDIAEMLKGGKPGIVVGALRTGIVLNPHMLEEGQEKVVADRLTEIIRELGRTPANG